MHPASQPGAHPVQVGLRVLGEVEVDHHVDRLDVDASREQVRGHQVAAVPVPEVVEDAVPVALRHLGVDVEARVAQLRDLLGQQLHAVDAVAEDDGLVDAQLRAGEGAGRGEQGRQRPCEVYVWGLAGWR